MEDYLGCRWFTPGEIGESIPSHTTVEVQLPPTLTGVKPSYELRNPWYNGNALPSQRGQNPDVAAIVKWGVRNRGGGLHGSVRQDWVSIFPKELQEKEPGLQAMINGKCCAPRRGGTGVHVLPAGYGDRCGVLHPHLHR